MSIQEPKQTDKNKESLIDVRSEAETVSVSGRPDSIASHSKASDQPQISSSDSSNSRSRSRSRSKTKQQKKTTANQNSRHEDVSNSAEQSSKVQQKQSSHDNSKKSGARTHDAYKQISLRKTQMCFAFADGKCPYSTQDCKYAHGKSDLRTLPQQDNILIAKRKQSDFQRRSRDGHDRRKKDFYDKKDRKGFEASNRGYRGEKYQKEGRHQRKRGGDSRSDYRQQQLRTGSGQAYYRQQRHKQDHSRANVGYTRQSDRANTSLHTFERNRVGQSLRQSGYPGREFNQSGQSMSRPNDHFMGIKHPIGHDFNRNDNYRPQIQHPQAYFSGQQYGFDPQRGRQRRSEFGQSPLYKDTLPNSDNFVASSSDFAYRKYLNPYSYYEGYSISNPPLPPNNGNTGAGPHSTIQLTGPSSMPLVNNRPSLHSHMASSPPPPSTAGFAYGPSGGPSPYYVGAPPNYDTSSSFTTYPPLPSRNPLENFHGPFYPPPQER